MNVKPGKGRGLTKRLHLVSAGRDELTTLPPLQRYLRRPGRLTDAGGAYVVLPVGLLDQLPDQMQEQLVAIATRLTETHRSWATKIAYQVLPWAKCRPGDLSPDELAWHGITHDVDPRTGSMGYLRGGEAIPSDQILGHRPASDPAATFPGSKPGARPPLLPPAPMQSAAGHTDVSTANAARTARGRRLITTQNRLRRIRQLAPTIDPSWADSIAASDELWGPEQDWLALAAQTTAEEAPPAVRTVYPVDEPPRVEGADAAKVASGAELSGQVDPAASSSTEVDDELAALEADLAELYKPE